MENNPIPPMKIWLANICMMIITKKLRGISPYLNQPKKIFSMAQLKPSDFITLRKKRMDWTMAHTGNGSMDSSLLSWESGRLTTGRDVNLVKLRFWCLGFATT